uniref:Cytochrome P450 90B1 n=1 Tax=Ananas comosus var. bracteatus TaxID=296719 RepID=A0A6V7QLG4_ANACO|nr:unnamed protein product [Ananas comosus var. bracteatus]
MTFPSPSTVLVIIFTIIVSPTIAIVVAQSLKSYRKKRNPMFPPGPMGGPRWLLLLLLQASSPLLSWWLHGAEPLKVWEGVQHELIREMMVVSADVELNRYVMQNEMRLFRNNLPAHIHRLIGDFALVMLIGDVYRHKKAIIVPFINMFRQQADFVRYIEHLAKGLMASSNKGGIIYVREFATKFSFYVVAKKAMGLTPEDPEAEQLLRDYVTFYKGLYAAPINFPGSMYRKALKARPNIIKAIKKKLDQRKAKESVDEEDDDLLGSLMKESTYTWENICDTILGFIFGGVATTSTAICLVFYLLENYPKALEEMRKEHLECMRSKKENGEEKLTWDDYKNMRFTQNVISETLRIGNVAPNLWKKATKDVEFKGYFIPEGTTVVAHLAAVHLNPSVFENPGQFNPWRW